METNAFKKLSVRYKSKFLTNKQNKHEKKVLNF